jgi:hypothetical protein
MPLFNKMDWRGIGRTVVVELLVLFALGFAVIRYVEWSSDVAYAEFMNATKPSASEPNHSGEFSTATRPVKVRSACPGKG